MTSCKSKEVSIQIFSQKYDNYEITISTIKTKINNSGIAQCSKYVRTTVSDTLYTSYGLQLKRVLAMAYETTPKYIGSLPFDSLKNKYFDVKIENFTKNKLNYDSILSLGISEAFNLEVTSSDRIIDGYELVVKDSQKLSAHQTNCFEGIINYKDGTWTMSQSRLVGFTKIIDQYSDSYVSFNIPNQNCYSIEFIVGNDFKKINDKLEHVGLMFNKTEFEQTFYEIKSVANKTYKQ
jgi:hypothetical protein